MNKPRLLSATGWIGWRRLWKNCHEWKGIILIIKHRIWRDFLAYVRFRGKCDDFMPWPELLVLDRSDSPSALECFARIESTGEIVPASSQPVLLRAAVEGKKLLNFHITELWSRGIQDASLLSVYAAWCGLDELRMGFPWMPEWVWRNVWKQAMRGHEFETLHPFDGMDAKIFGQVEFAPEI